MSTCRIGVKFAAIGTTKIKTAKFRGKRKKFFCHMVVFCVAGHIWYGKNNVYVLEIKHSHL